MSTISIEGLGALTRQATQLTAARERLGDFRTLHGRLGRHLTDWARRNIKQEGRLLDDLPAGWPPLAPSTLARRRRLGLGARPLQASGRLLAGLRQDAAAGSVLVGNPVPYAARHQLGSGVPRRPFLPGPAQTRRILHPLVQQFVEEALP